MPNKFLDLAKDVLRHSPKPLTYQEVWQEAERLNLTSKLNTKGKTPWQSLGAQLYVETRDNPASEFVKASSRPARFFLRARMAELPAKLERVRQETEDAKRTETKVSFKERDLHPLIAYFAYANLAFNRGRAIYTKTIFHEKSSKQGYNEWIHPDMVGFYLPLDDWHDDVIAFNRVADNNALKLYSFELKRSLSKSNYREAFFQAVSNSSWAHEGYLIAVDITDDDDFLAELERLASSFGIGIVQLDLEDLDSSRVLYPARTREQLDWETINKLCEQNSNFRKFLQDVRIDFESKRVHPSEYDEIKKDVEDYARALTGK